MSLLLSLFIFLQVLFLIHLFFPLVLMAVRRKGRVSESVLKPAVIADYAVIVTAYEQVNLIPAVVDSILKLNYAQFLIYVVADKCDISTLKFTDERVIILRPEETLANNVKSHFYAIDRFKRAHDRLTIIDSDNLVDPEYLHELNHFFDLGYEAVQGVREAKNLNTDYARLDAAGDIYYRYIDRKLLFEAGSSASLSGSGMAFTTELYRTCLSGLNSEGAGFDKILQYEILKRKLVIAFSERAIVFDEKTAKSDQLVKQRARWINTWFKFLFLGFKLLLTGVRNLSLNQVLFSVMLLRPPLFISLIFAGICFIMDLWLLPGLAVIWFIAGIAFMGVFFKALAYFTAAAVIYTALRGAHRFIFLQVLALFKAKKANKLSVATQHEEDLSIKDIQQ